MRNEREKLEQLLENTKQYHAKYCCPKDHPPHAPFHAFLVGFMGEIEDRLQLLKEKEKK